MQCCHGAVPSHPSLSRGVWHCLGCAAELGVGVGGAVAPPMQPCSERDGWVNLAK